jgi:mono/diheme cytochrome c family protein
MSSISSYDSSPDSSPNATIRRVRPGRRGPAGLLLPLLAAVAMAARCSGCESSRADVSVPDPPPRPHLAAASAPVTSAPAAPPTASSPTPASPCGWFTGAQADSGAKQFAASCAQCHGASLQGGAGPALEGSTFLATWQGRTLGALYSFVHADMPLTAPGSLTDAQYAAVTAYILKSNGFPAGSTPLAAAAASASGRELRPTTGSCS